MRQFIALLVAVMLITSPCWAKGGFSSGGFSGGSSRGSFSSSAGRSPGSSSSRSFSSSPGSSSRSYSSSSTGSSRSSTTIVRNYYGGGSGYYYHPYGMFPGFGMGYGYSDGLVEGLILGRLLFPPGTTAYTYGGYQGNAVMLPDGRVANEQGYQVGTYANGVFTPVTNGELIAKPAPDTSSHVSAGEALGCFLVIILLVVIIGMVVA